MKMPGKMRKLMEMEKSEHGGRLPSMSQERAEGKRLKQIQKRGGKRR